LQEREVSARLEVDLTDTLMAWADEYNMPSGERHSTYYLSVPDAWAALPPDELKSKVMEVFMQIYNAFNAHFRQVEPDDLSYLAPLDVNPRVLTAGEVEAAPWLTARVPAVWEWTPCVIVDAEGRYTKVAPSDFK
jgi:hypothetical protein